MNAVELLARIKSKVNMNTEAKQREGRQYAVLLGLQPGPSGSDDLIDGWGEWEGKKIYFQCKLSIHTLGAEYAHEFYCALEKHNANVGIYLSGCGYKKQHGKGFKARLESFPRIKEGFFKYHLLSLEDVYLLSPNFQEAEKDVPLLRKIRESF